MIQYIAFLLLMISFVWACLHVLTSNPRRSGLSKLPPGPHPFFIIKNTLQFRSKHHQSLANLSGTYGPLMTLKLGGVTTIVISCPKIAREILHKNDFAFSDRTVPDAVQALNHHEFSLMCLPDLAHWRNLRKICITQLFCPQKLDATQALRQNKVKQLLDHVHESWISGEAVDIGRAVFTTVLNLLSNTFFSVDLADHHYSNLSQEFKDTIWGVMEQMGKPNVVDYFPVLRLLDPQGVRKRTTFYFRKLIALFDDIIDQRCQLRASSKTSWESSDVLDTLLNFTEESDHSQLSSHDVKHLLLDLFIAGTDTTSNTLEWAMAELLHNPNIMAKARAELHDVLGKDRLVEESDISRLPYLQAIVKETFQLHPAAPFLLPHKAKTDVEISGFIVPKDAQVLVNMWAMGRDSNIWSNPNSFKPERFLEREIDVKGRDFELIPFGAGRRICPGLPLAHRMLHLMLASLLHSFYWKLENGMKPEDMDMTGKCGVTLKKVEPLRAIPTKI